MRFSPVRIIPGLVVSTGLFSASAVQSQTIDSPVDFGLNGFSRMIPFSALGVIRDPSCSEIDWKKIESERIPMDRKVIEYLFRDGNDHPATIRCEIPFFDWSLVTGRLHDEDVEIDVPNRTFTIRSLQSECHGYPCGAARKIIEELSKKDLSH